MSRSEKNDPTAATKTSSDRIRRIIFDRSLMGFFSKDFLLPLRCCSCIQHTREQYEQNDFNELIILKFSIIYIYLCFMNYVNYDLGKADPVGFAQIPKQRVILLRLS